MSQERDQALDRIVARALRWGAYAGVSVLAVAIVAAFFVSSTTLHRIEVLGVLIMIATPGFRVFVALIVFLKERDWRYSLITFGVLLILLLGSFFGIGEH